MATVSIRRSDGDSVTLDSSTVESLKADLRGPLFFPGDDGYDTAPYATGGVYVNFLTDDESDRTNQNIRPAQ
jgi:hypothetical protein